MKHLILFKHSIVLNITNCECWNKQCSRTVFNLTVEYHCGCQTVQPIGYMRSVFLYKNGTPRQPSLCTSARGSLAILKTLFNNPEHSLEGLEGFSHAWIIFMFHQNNNTHTKAKVKPPRLNGKRVGVFATRSPYRPNAIGLTLAKIDKISGSSIYFSGIDLIDGTPVLDIKPYIPEYDVPSNARDIPQYDVPSNARDIPEYDVPSNARDISQYDMPSSVRGTSGDQGDHSVAVLVPSLVTSHTDGSQGEAISVCSHSSLPLNSTAELEWDARRLEPDVCNKCTCATTSCCCGTCAAHVLGPGQITEPLPHTDSEDNQQKDPQPSAIQAVKEKLGCETKGESQISALETEQVYLSAKLKSGSREDWDTASCRKHLSLSEIPSGYSEQCAPSLTNGCMQSCGGPKSVFSNIGSSTASRDAKAREVVPGTPEKQQTGTRYTTHGSSTLIANWLASPPVSKLRVCFTSRAMEDLVKFNQQRLQGNDTEYKLDFLSEQSEIRSAIVSVLLEDPRSVYRRQKCQDRLYFFTVDRIHVTCWFDGDLAEVLKLQPISYVEKLTDKQLQV